MSDIKEFKLGELFCGPGGLAYGAMNAKIEDPSYRIIHQWANDYDESTCKTYARNICPENPESVVCEDVHFLEIEELGIIDALAFGFPCNDFSVVGEQLGFKGKFGPLYTYGVKALEIYKPAWFLAENVGGLKSANEGKAFGKILSDLKRAGYKIYPNLYKFEEYGIPQARHRVIIIGIREDLPYEFKIPAPSGIIKTCREAIEEPPIASDAPNNERTKQSPQVIQRLSYIKPGQNAFTADIPEELQLKIRGAKISQIYKRLDPEKPAYTVTGSGGGGLIEKEQDYKHSQTALCSKGPRSRSGSKLEWLFLLKERRLFLRLCYARLRRYLTLILMRILRIMGKKKWMI